MTDLERSEFERLNVFWDAFLSPDHPLPADGLTELAAALATLHQTDDVPDPDPAFLCRLRRDVLATGEPAAGRVPTSARSLGLVCPAPIVLPRRTVVRLAIAAIAATLLVAALSGGGRWLSGSGPAPMVASAMASTTPERPTARPTMPGSIVGQTLGDSYQSDDTDGVQGPTAVPNAPGPPMPEQGVDHRHRPGEPPFGMWPWSGR
jgi:hypothetical protein